jgi:hypothetical protein
MIQTLLDQTQKLFSRGFLIAAFIPSLLFVTLLAYLGWGYDALSGAVAQWTQKGLQEAGLELLLAAAGVYLLAYVLYGLRVAVYQVFQGQWPLAFLRTLGLRLEERAMAARQRDLDQLEAALNDLDWAAEYDFARSFVRREKLTQDEGKKRYDDYRKRYTELIAAADGQQRLDGEAYRRILHEARYLQTSSEKFDDNLRQQVAAFVALLKQDYADKPLFQETVKALSSEKLREWEQAYAHLYDSFPPSKRWLQATRLGNVTSVLELYPLDRYGIPLNALWPRLLHVIPEDFRKRIEEANIYMDFTLFMALLAAVAAPVPVILLLTGQSSLTVVGSVGITVGLLAAARIFYQLTISAFRAYAVQVQAAVDLFRLKLLDALELERPRTPEAEKALWTELRLFWIQTDLPKEQVQFKGAAAPPRPEPTLEKTLPPLLQQVERWLAARDRDKEAD